MTIESLLKVYLRDLNKLINEVELYENEEDLWIRAEGINNSAGNLTLHLVGNLNHFIGTNLGNTGYVRDRDKEFSDSGVSKAQLTADIRGAMKVVQETLPTIPHSRYGEIYPQKLGGTEYTTEMLLFHLLSHLSYHVGQINYHRRLLGRKV